MNYPYASLNLEADRAKKTVIQIFRTESEGPLDSLSLPNTESASVTNEQKETGKRSNSAQKQTGLHDIDDLRPSSYCSELNRLLRETSFPELVCSTTERETKVGDCLPGVSLASFRWRAGIARETREITRK